LPHFHLWIWKAKDIACLAIQTAQVMPQLCLSFALAFAMSLCSAVAQPPPLPGHLAADAAAIISLAASSNTSGWDRLADWVDLHGARLSGSAQLEKALDYALALMRLDGFDNVHEEIVNVSKWTRGEESLKMISPYNKSLNFLSIGSSVGTSGIPVVAPILVVSSFDELNARKSDAVGKIVVFNYYCDWPTLGGLACYEKCAGYRSVGANAAAAAGAVAVLVRSLTEFSLGTPHTVSAAADCLRPFEITNAHASLFVLR
jgi:carboxypeptidase Q